MRPWDEGVEWRSVRQAPQGSPAEWDLVMTVDYVTSQVLRVANGSADDAFVEAAIRSVTDLCEKETGLALPEQTWLQVMSRFPCGGRPIVLRRLPLIAVVSITYVDDDGAEQTMATSPADYAVLQSGEFTRAQITPLYDEDWPSTRCQPDAVTVTYRAGWPDVADIPERLKTGIGLVVAELYKQRTLSVHAVHNTPSVLQRNVFWRKVEG